MLIGSLKDGLSLQTGVYFIFTGICSQHEPHPEPQKDPKLAARITLDEPGTLSFITAHHLTNPWAIGNIISKTLAVRTGSICVYCSLCPTQIQTALYICAEIFQKAGATTVTARPVSCLAASCWFAGQNKKTWLYALIDKCKEIEAQISGDDMRSHIVRFIDRTWMEQQLFEAENIQEPSPLSPYQDTRHILEQHPESTEACAPQCAAIVILGEFHRLGHLINTDSFSLKARTIKPTQIFHFKKAS